MATHGKRLAASHTTLARGRVRDRLLARLADNERVLVDVCRQLTEAVADKRRVTPAGEWLLDNFYLLEEQVRMARSLLPEGYSRALPRLADSPTEPGAPRVYDIALETVSHGDGRVDAVSLGRFVTAYQTVTPLELGELWAIPIMLRLAVIENLRRVSVRVAAGWVERELAGGEAHTTNNRMELMAAICALMALTRSCQVRLTTDSQYVMKGIQEWLPNWKKRGWKTASKEPVKNADLWQALDEQVNRHQVEWQWVRGHTGHPGNEKADQLANRGVEEARGMKRA